MPKPLYLFYGDEDFLIDEKINELKKRYSSSPLNTEIFDGRQIELEALVSAIQISPLLGGDKLVIIEGLKLAAEEQEPFISILKNSPSEVAIIIKAEHIDRRSKLFKFLESEAQAHEFKTFAPWEQSELIGWIRERAGKEKKQITDEAAEKLALLCGSSLRLLASEIEKIAVFLGERIKIELDDVARLVSPTEASAFALADALRAKQLPRVIELFQLLCRNKEDLFQLMGLIASQYRLMLQLKALPAGKSDPWQVARALSASPYFVRKCMENLRLHTAGELRKAIEKIMDVNLKMKTGQSQVILLEMLFADLCGK